MQFWLIRRHSQAEIMSKKITDSSDGRGKNIKMAMWGGSYALTPESASHLTTIQGWNVKFNFFLTSRLIFHGTQFIVLKTKKNEWKSKIKSLKIKSKQANWSAKTCGNLFLRVPPRSFPLGSTIHPVFPLCMYIMYYVHMYMHSYHCTLTFRRYWYLVR